MTHLKARYIFQYLVDYFFIIDDFGVLFFEITPHFRSFPLSMTRYWRRRNLRVT